MGLSHQNAEAASVRRLDGRREALLLFGIPTGSEKQPSIIAVGSPYTRLS